MKSGHPTQGVALILGSSVVFCVMGSLIRYADSVDTSKIALFRFMIGLALLGTAALFGKIKLTFEHGPLLFLRGLTGGAGVFLFFLSISKLGIGKGTVISFSFPVFAAIFGAVLLKERVGVLKCASMAASLLGIFLLSWNGDAGGSFLGSVGKYELLAILGAAISGLAIVVVKKLHDTDSTYAIFFAQCLVGFWLVVIPANVVDASLGYSGGILLLCIGVTAATGQLLMTEGYRHVTVTTGSLLGMLVPVLNFLVGIFLFHEEYSLHAVLGAVIVILSCSLVIVDDRRPGAAQG